MTSSNTGTNVGSVTLNTVTTTSTSSTTNVTTTAVANVVSLGESAYMYARAKTITFSVQGLKPNTQYYPFFNGVSVAPFCSIVNGQTTSVLKTNALGSMTGNFFLPANTFLCGSHLFMLVDGVRTVSGRLIPDPIYGSAEARYEANGTLRLQQTQVTTNSVVNTNTSVTAVSQTTVTQPAPVVQCESWYFEYAVYRSGETVVFTITSNSSTPPAANTVSPQGGNGNWTYASVTMTYVSTTAGGGGVWYHTYSYRLQAGASRAQVQTYRQEWVGTTTDTRQDLASYRPSGLGTGDQITITVPWTKITNIACPVNLGFGTPTVKTTTNVTPYDPLAQSFFIDGNTYPDGVFVTSISVYFKTVDQSTPVILELRNMSNGLPGSSVFPGGRCLVPGAAAAQSPNASVATVFRFDYPIFLKPSEEYCFVVRSTSLGYNAWCSKIGEIDVTTNRVIDTQAFMGSMFMSENNYTWIPDGYQDIKFDLNVAVFDISKTSNIIIRPQKNTTGVINYYGTAQNLPLSFISTTKGSKVVKIKIPMHSLATGDKIVIDGIATPTPSTLYNNILSGSLNGTFTVTVVDEDVVNITTTGNDANKTGSLTIQDQFYSINNAPPVVSAGNTTLAAIPFVNSNTFSPSTIQTGVTVPSQPTMPTITSTNSFTVYTNIQVNEAVIDFMSTEMNQTTIIERLSIASGSSTAGSETPYSYIDYVELPRTNDFHLFQEPRMIATPLNEILHSTELSNNPSATVNVQLISRNKNVSPVIDTNGMALAVRSYKIDNQNGELTSLTTEAQFNNSALNSEIAPGTGNALAKYKTIVRSTTDYHQTMMLFVSANCPSPAYIDAYIRTSTDRETHIDQSWVWMPLNGVFGTTFTQSPSRSTVNEWMYEVTVDQPFNVYDIKLVMRSTNNSIIPKIYGLRTIADYL